MPPTPLMPPDPVAPPAGEAPGRPGEGFKASGFRSLRAYANYRYVTGAPLKILVATMIGAVTGSVGGLFGKFSNRELVRIHNGDVPASF